MDHRVSKDMISSGMTPSGERTQADLGKTQYGSAPSPNRLMDAYHSMYQNQKQENLDEKVGGVGKVIGGAADFASRNIKGAKGAAKVGTPPAAKAPIPKTEIFRGKKTGEPIRKASMIDTVRDRRGKIEDKEGITARREKVQGIMSKYGESVDLLAAYQSIYADTFEEGKIPAGLQAYLDKKKGKKKDDDDNGDEKKGKKSKGGKPDFLDLDKDGDKKESMKKASKEKKESVDLLAAYRAVYEHHKKDEDGNTIPHDDNVEEGVATIAGGAYGAKKDGIKGAIVGGTAGAMLDSMNKPKKVKIKVRTNEEVQQVDEVLGLAAGALGAMKGIAAGKAAGALAGKAAMRTAVKSGLTKTAAGKTAAKMGAKAAALKTGVPAAVSKGAMGALNYGTAGSIAGSAIGSGVNAVKNFISTPVVKKQNTTGTVSAGVDLFDIVKGRLLDEGLNEKEVVEIMTSLTLEEINEVIQLDEITGSLLMKASKAADKARGVAAAAGNKALATKKAAQSSKFYKAGAKKNIASIDYSKPLNPQRTDYPMGKGANYQEKPKK